MPGFGTAGGSNARTYVYNVPYIYGDGSNILPLWQRDGTGTYGARPAVFNGGCFVFDANGDFYFVTAVGTGTNGGCLIKASGTTGNLIWFSNDGAGSPLVVNPAGSQMVPVIGTQAIAGKLPVYIPRGDDASPTFYALDQATGTVIWQSAALPRRAQLNPALLNGTLYGITTRDSTGDTGNNYAYAIDAATGTILFPPVAIPTVADAGAMDVPLVPNAFGAGQHGIYFMVDNSPAHGFDGANWSRLYGVQVSTTGAALMWQWSPLRVNVNRIAYNAANGSIYAMHWGDYGSAVESLTPTGTLRWRASATELGANFNGGFYGTHTLKADSSGFIFAGFEGKIWSVTDPGNLGGANVPATQNDWVYPGKPGYRESQTMAALIAGAGGPVFVSGTAGASDLAPQVQRRLYGQDAASGTRIWEWFVPGDPAPVSGAFNFRLTSIGPDGAIYTYIRELGNGTIFKLMAGPPQHGACCRLDGSCTPDVSQFQCEQNLSGVWQGLNSTCAPGLCPQPGACCMQGPPASCEFLPQSVCEAAGGTFTGEGVQCAVAPCNGACCSVEGVCQDSTLAACEASGGLFMGLFSDCTSTACPPTAFCCLPSGCIVTLGDLCTQQGGARGPDNSTCADAACPPNDACANAIPIAVPSAGNAGDTTLATVLDPVPAGCCAAPPDAADVWYSLVGDGGDITLSMCAGAIVFDAQIAVYTGTCGNLSCVACNDDFCGGGGLSQVTFSSTPGTPYLVRVFGWVYPPPQVGPFVIDVTSAPPATGACCVHSACTAGITQAACTALGGVFQGGGSTCSPTNPCPVCAGDANCDGLVNFDDINYFVAALAGGSSGWASYYSGQHGGNPPPCPYLNNDANGNLVVNFDDINPFVSLLVSNPGCP